MTAPRQVRPGNTYLVTRRCFQRTFLLRPSPAVNDIFLYVLALAAQRFGVRVHAFCVMSNHFHLVVTDPDARLPAFEQYLDSLVARAVNASLGRWESFWAPSSYSAVVLATPEDVLDKAAYALANPVAAGLVRRGKNWPGLWSDPEHVGRAALVARRPETFFRKDGCLPERAELELSAPPGFDSPEQFREALAAALLEREQRHNSPGRRFLGVSRVLAQSPWSKPSSTEPRRGLNPRIGAIDQWKHTEVATRLLTFLSEYRVAWAAWVAGARDVLFPAGTYQLRVLHGACCASG